MKYAALILKSKAHLDRNADYPAIKNPFKLFSAGAKWMHGKLNEIDPAHSTCFNNQINFELYGLVKYGICVAAFLTAAVLFSRLSILLVPLAIIVFYLFEIHLLFLFPLLIDNVKDPVWASIKQTYRTGIFHLLITVMPIGFFIMAGLLQLKNPFRNWYIGSLAVIIWYHHEVRNRP